MRGLSSSSRIRVAIFGLPPLLHHIVRQTIASQEDLELVADVECAEAPIDLAEVPSIDVAVVASENGEISALGHWLLMSRPRMRVVEVAPGGDRADAYELRPKRTRITDVSPEGLLLAIRSVVGGEVRSG